MILQAKLNQESKECRVSNQRGGLENSFHHVKLPIPHMDWKASLICNGIFCISDDLSNADDIQY